MLDALTETLDGLGAWQATLLVLGVSLSAAVVLEFVVLRLATRFVSRTETAFDNIVVSELRFPLVVTAGLAGVFLLTEIPTVAASTVVTETTLDNFFGRPAVSVIAVSWAWALNQIVNRMVEQVKDRGQRFDFAPVFSNVWTIVVTVGALAALLHLWDIDVTPLLGAAGIAGVAVGFAAKDTVANFFGGIALYFDDTYKIGDYVVLDSGEAGTVVEVGVRSTTILTRDEVLVTVPNSVLNAARITNESAPSRRKRIRVPVGVAYGTDVDEFEELVLGIAAEESLVLDSPMPRMRLRSFGPSALEYELLCWVHSPTRAAKAKHALNREIYTSLRDRDIEIPYPKQDVYVHSTDPASLDDSATPHDSASDDSASGDSATPHDSASGDSASPDDAADLANGSVTSAASDSSPGTDGGV